MCGKQHLEYVIPSNRKADKESEREMCNSRTFTQSNHHRKTGMRFSSTQERPQASDMATNLYLSDTHLASYGAQIDPL